MLNYLLCTSIKRSKKYIIFKRSDYYFCQWACILQSLTFQTLGLTSFFSIHSLLQWINKSFDSSSVKCGLALYNHCGNCFAVSTQACQWPDEHWTCTSSDPTISLLSVDPKEMHTSLFTNIQVLECESTLSVTAWTGNYQTPINDKTNKWVHIMEYHTATRLNNLQVHTTVWMNLTNVVLRKSSQKCMISLTKCPKTVKRNPCF